MPPHLRLAQPPPAPRDAAGAQTAVRVILADDHALIRRSLRLLLDGEHDVDVVAEAEDLRSVRGQVHGHLPQVLVLDLSMPNGSSIELIRRLRDEVPATRVVVLTMEDSPAFAQHALDAGAAAFVLKDSADTELLAAVRAAASGGEYVSPRVEASLRAMREAFERDRLTPREVEVLRLTALGHTSAEIARALHLSRRTIETHRAVIHEKLGVRTRAELVAQALRRGLLEA